MTDYIKEFTKLLQNIDYSKRPATVFQDFLTVSTISFANIVYKSEELEKKYFEIIKEYKNPNMLAELLTITALALEEKTQDFLGSIYMRENFANKGTAQVFTPFHISECMAQMTFGENLESEIKEKGFITVSDPCCGSGVMTIGMAEALKSKDYNPQKVMWFQGTDIDMTCCKMAYIQTSLLGLSGEIVYGNTLTLECWKRFITPMTLLNQKIMNEIYLKKPKEKQEIKQNILHIEESPKFVIKQLSMFG